MRKLLALLVLIPFAAVVVLSCDDHPTAPQEAQAATTTLASRATQAKGPPALPAVTLADYTWVHTVSTITSAGAHGTTVRCPEGTNPIAGGGWCAPPAEYLGDMPTKIGSGPPEPPFGWIVWCNNPSDTETNIYVAAMCVGSVSPDAE